MKIKVTRTEEIEGEITVKDLGRAIFSHIVDEYLGGDFDDAGCDWSTYGPYTCIGHDPEWVVSRDIVVSRLVDAGNLLLYGKVLKLTDGAEIHEITPHLPYLPQEHISPENRVGLEPRIMELEDALRFAWEGLNSMTTEQFSRGEDRPIRDRIQEVLGIEE